MKKLYIFLIIALIVSSFSILFKNELFTIFEKIAYYSPCDEPISYSIGTIDSGFKTSRDELLKDAIEASEVWNKAENKELLKYDPSSSFTINMVYDDRQELTSKINTLNQDLKQKQNEIDPKIIDYKKRQSDFEIKLKELNDSISYWNSRGGAPKDDFDKLVALQKELREEANSLNAEARSLGQETSEYNANAKNLNKTIDDYQGVLVVKPEEGLYEQDGKSRKISLYIDVSHEEFLHTLIHEFGHALGLEHNSNPKSIMFPQTSNVLTPSNQDLAELENVCKKRTTIEIFFTRFDNVVNVLRNRFTKSN